MNLLHYSQASLQEEGADAASMVEKANTSGCKGMLEDKGNIVRACRLAVAAAVA